MTRAEERRRMKIRGRTRDKEEKRKIVYSKEKKERWERI